ncbi:hypothetical protein WJX84_012092 [Apatococcus fuscideae]|uniref:methylated diphthine methylhydrolase n=1 Tax=Apatococcus fuscideae TaxID=2026836 RepID=A0AAW1SR85_9CHLO
MVLSVDSHRQPGSGTVLAASTASGQAAQVQARESELKITQRWSAHELEVWTAAFDHWQGNLLHTGADDAVWHGWDLRDCATPAFSIRKEHKAGVCCIQSHPQQEHIICTGSYDESARIWDCRSMSRPLLSAKLATGGGVWRLRWHPQDPDLLLAACMQEGFKVLRCGSRFNAIYMQQHYGAQRTLAYGADWSYAANQPQLVATCSFYDRQVKVMDALLDVAASMSTGCGTPGGQEELSGSEGGAVDTEKGPAEEDRGARSEQSTRFRGVYKNRHDGKWRAEITSGRRKKSLGLYGRTASPASVPTDMHQAAMNSSPAHRMPRNALGKGSSKFRGVSWHKDNMKWRATIFKGSKPVHIGYFDSQETAARAYDQESLKLRGPNSNLNFPLSSYAGIYADTASFREKLLSRMLVHCILRMLQTCHPKVVDAESPFSGSADTSSLLPGGLGSFGQGFLNMSRPGSASGSRPPSAQHLSDLGPLHSSSPTLEATLLHHQRASSSPSSLVHLLADPAGPSQGLQRPMSDPSRFDQRSASSSLRWGDKGLRTDLTSLHRQRPPLNGRRISTENKDHNGGSAPRNDHPAYSAAPDQEMPAPPKRPRVL